MIKSKKAVNEIISTILIMLVMVIVVGIIITGINSQISKGKEKLNYDNSIIVRDLVFSEIMEIYNSPIEATKEINFSLSNLELTIDSDTETIEICSVGKNLSFFADGKRLEQDNNKYVYREMQKICSGVAFENIDLIRSITLSNKEQTRLVFKKITENKISVSVDNETSTPWYTQKNEYVYDENAGEWKYRKKIMITGNNILGDLNNIPITITLSDDDLKNYAKVDGSDLLFTLSDGVTKLKKEIISYDSGTGELTVLLTIPSFDIGADVNVYTYDEKTRKKITIDHTKVDSDLNDFPVLISIKDENLVNLANSDGNDIYFTASDGTTKLKREIESFTDINLFRKKITIDHTKVDANLTDFPVLISIKDENLVSLAKEDGSDIYFTSSAGNRLKREIEDYNSTTGALVAWVKVPSLSSTVDTNIYINFGSTEESNTNDTDVWDSNYVGVWHNRDYNANSIKESKTGLISATKTANNEPIQNTGKVGPAQYFDGANDSIDTNIGTISYTKSTISFWANFEDKNGVYGNCGIIVGSAYWSNNNFSITQHSNDYQMMFTVGTSKYSMFTTAFSNTGTWYYYSYSYDSDQNAWADALKAYINGATKSIGSSLGDTDPLEVSGTNKLKISTCAYFNGLIDEVRISDSLRSSSWVKTEYNNQSSPSTFYSVGSLEDVTINLVAWVKVPSLSSTVDTDIYMYFGDENESNSNDANVWDVNAALVMHFNNNALDSTSYTNTTTVSGSPEYATGIGAKAMYFDGNNDSISLGNKTISSPLQMREGIVTVEHWINISNTYNYSSTYFFMGSAGGSWVGYGTGYSFGSQLYRAEVYGSTAGRQAKYLASGSIYNLWKHQVVVFDGINNRITFYVDGNQVSQQSISEPGDVNSTTKPFIIGSHSWTSFFKGLMDELRVYNKELSAPWIKTEYNNQSSPSTFSSVGEMADANVVILTTPTAANANTGVYVYFGNPDANISDNDIGDGNTVNVTIGVLEKS